MKYKKLHIVFLDFDDIFNPLLGGGQAHATEEVGKRLAKMGHKVSVICSRFPESKDQTSNGIFYKHIGLGTQNIKINNLFYILSIPLAVSQINADIIIECFTAPISTMLTPLFTKIPVVGLPTSFDAQRFSKLYHMPLWIIEKYGSRLYKYFIALTPYLKKKMLTYNAHIYSKVIGQGVGKEFLQMAYKNPEYILFLGRLDINQKGIDLLIESYKKIAYKIGFPLVIAGEGPDRKIVERLVEKNNLDKKIKRIGFADKNKKMHLLEKAAFIAFPSRNEGFSLFSLEAIASGKRLVSFDIPSLSYAKKEVARKVKPFDTDLYAKAILEETQEGNWKTKSRISKEFAKKYSWENVANEFNAFFQEILKREEKK